MGQLKRASNPSRDCPKTLENTRVGSSLAESCHGSELCSKPSQSNRVTYGKQGGSPHRCRPARTSSRNLEIKGFAALFVLGYTDPTVVVSKTMDPAGPRDGDKEHG